MTGLRDQITAPPPVGVELTVVIAAYQAERTLGEQLDALAAQCVPFGWEVVVADNGSTDGTVAVARSYVGRLPSIRVVDASARRGAGAARNVGVAAARGAMVAFCDADDVVAADWLAAMHAALGEHDFVAGSFEGRRLNDAVALRSRVLPQQDGLQESGHLPGLQHAGAGNLGLRTEVFRSVGGFDPGALYLEDTDLCWRVQLSGVPLVYRPEAVVHVRLRGGLRASARQGYDYGTGERWLGLRYREEQTRLAALAVASADLGEPADALPGLVPVGAAAGPPAPPPVGRSTASRAVHRLVASAGALLRVRSTGELAAWCWDVAWGIGYAFGHVEQPAPVAVRPMDRPGLAA
ncbi:MAG TPA: glycosyltransferase family A protein [Cellulomonas sp.]